MLNLTKKGRQRLVRHRVQFKKISRGRNFGEKNVGRIRTFLGEDHRQRQPSDTTSGNGKVAGTAPLSPVRMPYSGISCLFEKFSNFMQMQRRGGTATRRTRERGCSSLPRIRVSLLLFLPSFYHSRGYSLYCFAKETGAWNFFGILFLGLINCLSPSSVLFVFSL